MNIKDISELLRTISLFEGIVTSLSPMERDRVEKRLETAHDILAREMEAICDK